VYVRFLGAFAEVQNASIAFVMSINFLSVWPHVLVRLPVDRFPWSLLLVTS